MMNTPHARAKHSPVRFAVIGCGCWRECSIFRTWSRPKRRRCRPVATCPFCVGHNRRSSPAMIEAHRIFRAHMEHPEPCPWRFDREGEHRPHVAGDAQRLQVSDAQYGNLELGKPTEQRVDIDIDFGRGLPGVGGRGWGG